MLDGASRVVRKLLPWTPVKAVAQSVVWDGKSDATGTPTPAAEGRHTFVLTVKDAAGNARTVKSEVVLDRTLGFPTVTPATFSPNGDGVLDTTSVAFKLTRAATVRVTVQQSGSAVATVFQGALAAGSRAAEWNGRLSAGGTAASGVYSARISAQSTLGTVLLVEPFTVDLTKPRLTAPATASATAGTAAKLAYSVRDLYSPTVRVWVAITGPAGALPAVSCGWVQQGKPLVAAWKPPARGQYTLLFRGQDRAGNRQAAAATTHPHGPLTDAAGSASRPRHLVTGLLAQSGHGLRRANAAHDGDDEDHHADHEREAEERHSRDGAPGEDLPAAHAASFRHVSTRRDAPLPPLSSGCHLVWIGCGPQLLLGPVTYFTIEREHARLG